MTYLFENSDFSRSGTRIPPQFKNCDGKLNATGSDSDRARALAAASIKYPYPPVNCDEALAYIDAIDADIQNQNEQIASGIDKKWPQTNIGALQQVKQNFVLYTTKMKCAKAELDAESNSFLDQVQGALGGTQTDAAGKKAIDNWIIYGVLGVLFIGTMIIIFKRKQAAA